VSTFSACRPELLSQLDKVIERNCLTLHEKSYCLVDCLPVLWVHILADGRYYILQFCPFTLIQGEGVSFSQHKINPLANVILWWSQSLPANSATTKFDSVATFRNIVGRRTTSLTSL